MIQILIIIFTALCTLYLICDHFSVIGPSKIKNLPSVPGFPIVGNLFQVMENPCLKYLEWSKERGDVFQIRLGNQRVVVANSFDSIKELWIKNCTANNSRPELYTFHKIVSRSDIYTVGTTPFGTSYKKKRKFISTHLHKKQAETHSKLILDEASATIFRIASLLAQGDGDISLLFQVQCYSLRISLMLTFGYLIDLDDNESALAKEIVEVENAIVHMRSHTSNLQDYLPFLRYCQLSKNSKASELNERRSKYMTLFFETCMSSASPNEDSLVAQASSDPRNDLKLEELKSICLSMVSAGLDNTALNLEHCIGQLAASPQIQATLYRQLVLTYGSAFNAWEKCGESFLCDYAVAVIRETLRYFTVLPLGLPRVTTRNIIYKDATIPAGTMLFMNAYAGNHDEKYFPNSHSFIPERYLDSNNKLLQSYSSENGKTKTNRIPSFSFGVGSRMCAGSHLAFKELYILLVKLVIMFEFSESAEDRMELDPLKANRDPSSIVVEPNPFKVHVKIRDDKLWSILKDQEVSLSSKPVKPQ